MFYKKAYRFFQLRAFIFKIFNFLLHFCFLLFRLQGFSHAKGDTALIEGLICLDRHSDFVSDSY